MKPCAKCGGVKDYAYKTTKGVTYYRCRKCQVTATAEWKAENEPTYHHVGKPSKPCVPVPEKKPKGMWRPKWANSKYWHSEVGVSLQYLVESVRLGRAPYIKGAKP